MVMFNLHGQYRDVAKISPRVHQYITTAGIEFKDWMLQLHCFTLSISYAFSFLVLRIFLIVTSYCFRLDMFDQAVVDNDVSRDDTMSRVKHSARL